MQNLPPEKECQALITDFFSHWHPDYPILHRPSFNTLVESLHQCTGPPAENFDHNGWPSDLAGFRYNGEVFTDNGRERILVSVHAAATQLLLVLSISAHLRVRKRRYQHDPTRFYGAAMALSRNAVAEASLASIQILLLLVLYSFHSSDGGNTWIMLHMAMSYAIDLGLHRDMPATTSFPEIAVQMRRRVFFCTYSLERLVLQPPHEYEIMGTDLPTD